MKLTYSNDESPSREPVEQEAAEGFVRGADGRLYPQGSDPRTRKSLRRRTKWAIAGLVLLVTLSSIPLTGWYMLSQTPARYTDYRKQLRQSDPVHLQQVADDLEAAVLGDLLTVDNSSGSSDSTGETTSPTHAQLIKGLKVEDLGKDEQGRALRRVELGPQQVNAWLAASFSEWLEYRDFDMPAEIRSPMVDVINGKTTMFFTFESETFSQIFQAQFNLAIGEDGMATLQLDHMQAGRVPVPVASVGDLVSKAAGQAGTAQRASQWIAKIQNYRFKPAMKLPDGLKAQILDYKPVGDKLILTLRVERYRPSSKGLKANKVASVKTEPAMP